jgi:hypothetical protein
MTTNNFSDVQLNDFLPPLSPWVRFGSLGVVALLGSTIALTTKIPHRSTTQVTAIVAPNKTIQAFVPADAINQLAPQQMAQMRVMACPYSEFGTLKGQVTAINDQPIQLAPQFNQPTLYAVTIQPQQLALQQGLQSCPVRVGMQGKVDIVLREESMWRSFLRRMRVVSSSQSAQGLHS